ncbi:MAG TPA: hypothetical protein VGG57_17640 [Stellaceae bacterium]|jgi:hypothetical protein
MGIPETDAVLIAAEAWVSAQETLVAAKQKSSNTEADTEAADIAGSQLVLAVARWRSSQPSKLPETSRSETLRII